MKQSKIISLFLFFFMFLLINPIYSLDEFGDTITTVSVYEYDTRIGTLKDFFSTNPTTTNVTIKGGYDLVFFADSALNSTEWDNYYTALNGSWCAIQLFSDSGSNYQNAMNILEPIYDNSTVWLKSFYTDKIELDCNEIIYANVTHWVNYNNGSSWLLEDEWKFNLIKDTPYTPPIEDTETEINGGFLTPFFFWGMVACGGLTPMCFVASIRLHDGKFIGWGLMAFVGFISFLGMLTGIHLI